MQIAAVQFPEPIQITAEHNKRVWRKGGEKITCIDYTGRALAFEIEGESFAVVVVPPAGTVMWKDVEYHKANPHVDLF